jgi:hypothetical protein
MSANEQASLSPTSWKLVARARQEVAEGFNVKAFFMV